MNVEKMDIGKVGERIQLARNNKKLTQEQVSTMIGCTSKHISAVETGNTRPSIELLIALSNVLDVTVDHLLMDDSRINPSYVLDVEMRTRAEEMTAITRMACIAMMDQLLVVQNSSSADDNQES